MIKVISRQEKARKFLPRHNCNHSNVWVQQSQIKYVRKRKKRLLEKIDILLPGCVRLSTDLPVNRSTRCSFYCSLQLCIDHHSHSIIITKQWSAAFCWWTPLAGDYVKNLRFARICWYGHLGNLDVSLQGPQKGNTG